MSETLQDLLNSETPGSNRAEGSFQTKDHKKIRAAVKVHPTLLLLGPSSIGSRRAKEAIVDQFLDPSDPSKAGERDLALKGNHPDLLIADGRELKTDEAREIRDRATSNPARWTKKHLILSYIDRPHPSVAQILLKLIEEPPPHFITILTTDRLYAIPQTIPSRAFILNLDAPTYGEILDHLKSIHIDEPDWRASICGGDPDVAEKLEPDLCRRWQKLWMTISEGTEPPLDFPYTWAKTFSEALGVDNDDKQKSLASQTACWEILISLLRRKVGNSGFWRETALIAWEARDNVKRGRANKISIGTALANVYAYSLTAVKRKK
jgi:hypothetical protein